jgi:signal transduction histidine kinase
MWIEQHNPIKVALDTSYAPLEFYEDNIFKGISKDFLDYIDKRSIIDFEYVYIDSWDETISSIQSKEVDMIGGLIETDLRKEYMIFSESFFQVYDILIVRNESNIESLNDLDGLNTGAISGYVISDFLKEKFPSTKVVEVKDIKDGLNKLYFGQLDAFVTQYAQALYYIKEYGYVDFRTIEQNEFLRDNDLKFGIRDDYIILQELINIGLDNIPITQKYQIKNQWLGSGSEELLTILKIVLLIVVFSTFITFVLIFLNRYLKREIESKTQKIQEELDTIRIMEEELTMLNHTLEIKVEERTEELNKIVEELRFTQEKLIENEKMAALSNLIVGIAHEINTPLGVCISSSSYIDSVLNQNGNLENITDANELIRKNLERLRDIVETFKQISVDYSSDERSEFLLKDAFDLAYYSFIDKINNKNVVIYNSIPPDFKINSYYKQMFQIFVNLISNSLEHGFKGTNNGFIKVSLILDDNCNIIFEDNGIGIKKDKLKKVVEPFITTARAQGHMGLGLNIVYNSIVQKMNGTMTLLNNPDGGLRVIISLKKEGS